jgi:hypothetical protein
MTAISVIFASRGRPQSLAEAVESLTHHASDPLDLEVIVAVDPDDPATITPSLPYIIELWMAPERYGYNQLHKYLNPLAKRAEGDWLMWWNDDMRMLTGGWDEIIRQNRPAVIWPHANHVPHTNIAPAWPRAWSDKLGYASPSSHMDTYWHYVGDRLGRHDRVPIEIKHDRADVTGNHDDQTYAEGRKLLGSEGMVPGFDLREFTAWVDNDVARLRELL